MSQVAYHHWVIHSQVWETHLQNRWQSMTHMVRMWWNWPHIDVDPMVDGCTPVLLCPKYRSCHWWSSWWSESHQIKTREQMQLECLLRSWHSGGGLIDRSQMWIKPVEDPLTTQQLLGEKVMGTKTGRHTIKELRSSQWASSHTFGLSSWPWHPIYKPNNCWSCLPSGIDLVKMQAQKTKEPCGSISMCIPLLWYHSWTIESYKLVTM